MVSHKSTATSSVSRRISRTVKRGLHLLASTWRHTNKKQQQQDSYNSLPSCDQHQEEQDENAINELLERRLMEIIASSPQQQDHHLLKVEQVHLKQQQHSHARQVSIPADPSFDLLVCLMTRCQDAQPQV